jgi:glycosyltransferase involved in cell wall biosynthesis
VASTLEDVKDAYYIDTTKYPGLNITLLPYRGNRGFFLKVFSVFWILRNAAETSSVWHTGCFNKLFDLTALSFYVGRYFAPKLRVLCLDSDPASIAQKSGIRERWKAPIIRARYRKWAREVDATIIVGTGAADTYARYARRSVITGAVWLNEGDLANEQDTIKKFGEHEGAIVRIALPTRLTQWKGVDDVIKAFKIIGHRLPPWHLDIIGEGPEREKLRMLAAEMAENISFVDQLQYGDIFFTRLRTYHLVLVPTRGLEEARIAYDAAASGCVIVHSNTSTLSSALFGVKTRWVFEPGDTDSLANSIVAAFDQRRLWGGAAIQGIEAMKGRTINEMHEVRQNFLRVLR